jgi:integrase
MDRRADRKDLDGITCPEADNATVHDLIEKYLSEVASEKPSHEIQSYILRSFQRHRIAKISIRDLTPLDFTTYKEERLAEVSATTFNHQIGIIQHAFDVAIKEWNWPLRTNPLKMIRRPKNDPGRSRRLTPDEESRLYRETENSRNPYIKPVIEFALATAMRRGEILRMKWQDINFEAKILHIPVTKNGHPRTIPLSSIALQILESLKENRRSRKERVSFHAH